MKSKLLVGMLCAVAFSIVTALDSFASERLISSRLARTKMTLEWKEMQLEQAFKEVGSATRVNFVLTPALREEADLERGINLELTKIKASSLLNILSGSFELEYVVKGNVVLVTTPQDAVKRSAVLRVYDVSHLMYRAPDFKGPEIVLKGSEGFDDIEPEPDVEYPEQPSVDEILELIRTTTNSTKWDFEGVSIDTFGSRKIIVKHTPEMQMKVRRVIMMLGG